MEETQIMEIWDLFLEHIPEKNRDIVATQLITEIERLQELLEDRHYDFDDEQ